MRLLNKIVAASVLAITPIGCHIINPRLEKRVEDAVVQIEQKSFPRTTIFNEALDDERVKNAVKKNLQSLLASREWKRVLFYCSDHDLNFLEAAIEAINNPDAQFYKTDGGLPAFVEQCKWEDEHFIENKETRDIIFKALESSSQKMKSPYEIQLLQRILEDYPDEKEICLQNVVRTSITTNTNDALSRAISFAAELPPFLEKTAYENLAAYHLQDIELEKTDNGRSFVRRPQWNDVLEALKICKKIDANFKDVSESLLEKLLIVFDDYNHTGISASWVSTQYQEKGYRRQDAVSKSLIFFVENLNDTELIERCWQNRDLFQQPPTQDQKNDWLVTYAHNSIRNLSEVITLSRKIEDEKKRQVFFDQSFQTFVKRGDNRSFDDAFYLALNYLSPNDATRTEHFADKLMSSEYVHYDSDDPRHSKMVVPSPEDIRRAIVLLKMANPDLENLTQPRFRKILYGLATAHQTPEDVVRACAQLNIPRTTEIADDVVNYFLSRQAHGLLSCLSEHNFTPSKKVAQEYCTTILERGTGSIKDVFLFTDKYDEDPFSAKQYILYGCNLLSKKDATSETVRNSAWAFEHSITVKKSSRPSDNAFENDVQRILRNPAIDVNEIIGLYAALERHFGEKESKIRLKIFEEKTTHLQLAERIKLYYHITPALPQTNDDFKYALLKEITKSIQTLSSWELMACTYSLRTSTNSTEYVRLAGDFMIENGRRDAGLYAWILCKYDDGIRALTKRKNVLEE